jgi:23S rRNA (cytosine1962-C5)-methyltransferase
LDSGRGRKLEQVGPYLLDRQAPQALWAPRLPEDAWRKADAIHHRSDKGGGHWEARRTLPEEWPIAIAGLTIRVRPTPFGHLGLFAEQGNQWSWLREQVSVGTAQGEVRVLNLFAYTGIATLSCASAGASVCHVDAAHGVVAWARENAVSSGLADRPLRWIVDDALRFCTREARRERTYHGIILDPPTFGRGSRKETWRIEDDLPVLLQACAALLDERPLFCLLSCHTPGMTPIVLHNMLADAWSLDDWDVQGQEMTIRDEGGRLLPAGSIIRTRRAAAEPTL